jgi:hypothetical protein
MTAARQEKRNISQKETGSGAGVYLDFHEFFVDHEDAAATMRGLSFETKLN